MHDIMRERTSGSHVRSRGFQPRLLAIEIVLILLLGLTTCIVSNADL